MAPIILEVQNIEVEVQNIEVEMQNIEVAMQKIHEEQNTIIEEGDEGLPLIPIYNKSQTSSVIQDTFVLPTKKRKKPVQVAQEALVYLQLTNKSSKRIQDQSLGLSKRTLYSPDIDELEDELVLNNVESVPPTLPCSSGLSHHVQIVEPIKKQLINTRCAVSIPATLADDVLTETPEAVVDNVQKQYNKKTSRDLSQEVNQAEVEVCEENFEPAIVQNRVSKRISALKAAKASTDKEPIKKNNTSSAKGKIVLKGAIKKASSQDTQSGSAVTKVSKAPSETGKADKLNAKNSSPISTKSKSNMKSASTNQRNQPADTEEVCLRRGTRERKLPRMFWSTRHADVCFRYGVVDKPEAKVTKTKRLVNKNIPTLVKS